VQPSPSKRAVLFCSVGNRRHMGWTMAAPPLHVGPGSCPSRKCHHDAQNTCTRSNINIQLVKNGDMQFSYSANSSVEHIYVYVTTPQVYLPSSLNRSKVLPSSLLATKNHKQLIQHSTTPVQEWLGILNKLSMTSWKALLGTATNVAVSGLVALINSRVDAKTAKLPRAPHQIISQKKGTSRKGMLRTMWGMPPETRTIGVRSVMEMSEV
jgi:hypothetical protein